MTARSGGAAPSPEELTHTWRRAETAGGLPSGRPLRTYPNTSGCFFNPDGRLFAAGPRIVETDTGKEVTRLTVPVAGHTAAFRPDGRHLARLDEEGGITVWDTSSWAVVRR